MLKLSVIIAKANQGSQEDAAKLDNVLISQANNGVTIEQALKGHCSGPASNPVFIDQVVGQLRNGDGAAVTAHSPLMSVIHLLSDEPGCKDSPDHPQWQSQFGEKKTGEAAA